MPVCMCLSVCVSVPHKRFLGNYWSHHLQTWHGDFLTHVNVSHVNYIDLDLHSRLQGSLSWKRVEDEINVLIALSAFRDNHEKKKKGLIISGTFKAMPIMFAVKIVWLKVCIIFSQSDDLDLYSRSQLHLKLYKLRKQ